MTNTVFAGDFVAALRAQVQNMEMIIETLRHDRQELALCLDEYVQSKLKLIERTALEMERQRMVIAELRKTYAVNDTQMQRILRRVHQSTKGTLPNTYPQGHTLR